MMGKRGRMALLALRDSSEVRSMSAMAMVFATAALGLIGVVPTLLIALSGIRTTKKLAEGPASRLGFAIEQTYEWPLQDTSPCGRNEAA